MPKTSIGRSMRAVALVAMFLIASLAPLAQAVAHESDLIHPNGGASWAQLTPVAHGPNGDIWIGVNYCCSYSADRGYGSDGQISSVVGRMRDGDWVWSLHLTSAGKVATDRISVNETGYSMVTGHFWDSSLRIQGTTYQNQGGYDTFFIVLNPNGNIMFHELYGSSVNDGAGAVHLSDDGEAIIIGHAGDATSIDVSRMNASLIDYEDGVLDLDEEKGKLYANFTSKDILVRRYSMDGQLRLIRAISGVGTDSGQGVALLEDGGLVVSGLFGQELILGNHTLVAETAQDFFAAKLSAEGDWLWAISQTGVQSKSKSKGKIARISDDLLIAGWSFGESITIGNQTYNPSGERDVAIALLDGNGSVLELTQLGGMHEEHLRDVTSNGLGDVAVLFESESNSVQVGDTLHNGTSQAIALIIRNGTEIVWSDSVDANAQIYARDIAMSETSNVSIGGYHSGTAQFNNATQSGGGSTKSFVWSFVIDTDSDGVADHEDNCRFTSNPGQENLDGVDLLVEWGYGDYLGDVCDLDIDGDFIENRNDSCPFGMSALVGIVIVSNSTIGDYETELLLEDYDSDGCMNSEDRDDDNDWVYDIDDSCRRGIIGWRPNGTNDYDWDGCRDADEDDDDDSDTVLDVDDECPYSPLGWISNFETDVDGDGCIDDWSTNDADADGWNDTVDFCPDEWGNSTKGGILGCIDTDGDGWADIIDVEPEDPEVFLPPPPEVPVPVPPQEEPEEREEPHVPIGEPEPPRLSTEMLILGGMFALVMVAFTLVTLTSRRDDVLQRDLRRANGEQIETLRDPPF